MTKKRFPTEINSEQNFPQLSARVLVAEDSTLIQQVLTEMIEILGCNYKAVSSGSDVLKSLAEESFDVVLMAAMKPELNGYEATEKIRQGFAGSQNRMIPVIEVSDSGTPSTNERHLLHGMNDRVAKPIVLEELVTKLQFWTERGKNVVDIKALKRLRQVSKGEELIRDLAKIFFDEVPKILAQLSAMNKKDGETFKEFILLAHGMKSNCATIGAFRMKDLAFALEKSKLSTVEERSHLISQLEIEFDFFSEEFVKFAA